MRSGGKPARPDDAFGGGQAAGGFDPRAAFGNAPAPSCGALFHDLRVILRMSLDDAAAVLSTRPDVIAALESDNFMSLPPWPETVRIVKDYTGLAGIDAGPMLGVLQAQLVRYDVYARHEATLATAAGAGAVASAIDGSPNGGRQGWLAGFAASLLPAWAARLMGAPILKWGAPAAFAVAALLALIQLSGGLQASASQLPPPLSRWVMSAQDFLLAQIYPRRDGYIWIEVSDPRSRRGDKLTVTRK